jgi:hypothetical protein
LLIAAKLRGYRASIQIMRDKNYFFLFLFLLGYILTPFSGIAQKGIDGNWEGTITMEQDGKTIVTYKLVLQLSQDSSQITGYSWIWYNDLKANFSLQGNFEGINLTIKDDTLMKSDVLPSGEWCIKEMFLTLIRHRKYDKLEGTWRGKTSFSQCTPGKISLKKITDRV